MANGNSMQQSEIKRDSGTHAEEGSVRNLSASHVTVATLGFASISRLS